MRIAMLVVMAATSVALPATAHAEPIPPCSNGQVVVTAGKYSTGLGHRGLELIFNLAAGARPCTLTGYPGVDSGSGGPLVTPPDTTDTVTVLEGIDGLCHFQVHPVGAEM
jgi:hypothetical protein